MGHNGPLACVAALFEREKGIRREGESEGEGEGEGEEKERERGAERAAERERGRRAWLPSVRTTASMPTSCTSRSLPVGGYAGLERV